ncbi:uncharacterized protein LOC122370895 [Amphibalanus amphitrite]|uniref:uncharacterized protein LOC122370895 n=1 Tax=Amphibalanus amphitrite TaxID=1232801 RepID=UPI001C91B872|nr:uncharacterized protein LOC122370895 [Amphibalanus amphitrite]
MTSFGNILHSHEPEPRQCIRRLESLNKKKISAHYAVVFNKTCIKENLLPNYSNLRLHDRAVQQEDFVYKFRQSLTGEQLKAKEDLINDLEVKIEEEKKRYDTFVISQDLRKKTDELLDNILIEYEQVVKTRILKKLSHLYKGPIALPGNPAGFINLSSVQLTSDQEKFLNLGLNCHFYPKFDPHKKKTEIALLFDDLCKLHDKGQITLKPEIQPQLQAEAAKRRIKPQHSVLTPNLRKAAQELRNNDDIVIRRADKSSIFVILDKEDYYSKVRSVLQDTAKFKRITRDTTAALKTRVNKLVDAANAVVDGVHLQKVTGSSGTAPTGSGGGRNRSKRLASMALASPRTSETRRVRTDADSHLHWSAGPQSQGLEDGQKKNAASADTAWRPSL